MMKNYKQNPAKRIKLKNLFLIFLSVILGFGMIYTTANVEISTDLTNAVQVIKSIIIEQIVGTGKLVSFNEGGSTKIKLYKDNLNRSGVDDTLEIDKVLGINNNGEIIFINKSLLSGGVGGTGGTIIVSGDDLGNHTAIQNINLGNFWLSPDGTNKGIQFEGSSYDGVKLSSLAGSTNRCVRINSAGILEAATNDCGVGGGSTGDDLGNHTAIQNIILGNKRISRDGTSGGISIDASQRVILSSLTGVGNRCIQVTAGGLLQATSCTSTGYADNLGDHTAIDNIRLNTYRLSNDGDAEGIRIDDNGNIILGNSSTNGAGNRTMRIPSKRGFRAGGVNGTQRDIVNIGSYSIGFGENTMITSDHSSILGGMGNSIDSNAKYSTIGGGYYNTLTDAYYANIAGGEGNINNSAWSNIGGGGGNEILNSHSSVIGGGALNKLTDAHESFIGGGRENTITTSTSANIVGGTGNNILVTNLGFIGGGGWNEISYSFSSIIGGGRMNKISNGNENVIAGGYLNNITGSSTFSSIAGGQTNQINSSNFSFIGGGTDNYIQGNYSFAGGYKAKITASKVFLRNGGADIFTASINNSFIINAPGGVGINLATPTEALDVSGSVKSRNLAGAGNRCLYTNASGVIFAKSTDCGAGTGGGSSGDNLGNHSATMNIITNGYRIIQTNGIDDGILLSNDGASVTLGSSTNSVASAGSTIAGGGSNTIGAGAYGFIGGGFNNNLLGNNGAIGGGVANKINLSSSYDTIGGGKENEIFLNYGTIGGGYLNYVNGNTSSILGGQFNQIYKTGSTIGGGNNNYINGDYSFIGGGKINTLTGNYLSLGGGQYNIMVGNHLFIGGGSYNQINNSTGSTIGGGLQNKITSNSSYSNIVGGYINTMTGEFSSIIGGKFNTISGTNGFIGGGSGNKINQSIFSFIGNGSFNQILGSTYSSIIGGINNIINSNSVGSLIGGGELNTITGLFSSIIGGYSNTISGTNGFIGGGKDNTIIGDYGSILGGADNHIQGEYSFAGGQMASNKSDYTFLRNADKGGFTVSGVNEAFIVNVPGGFGIGTATPRATLDISGSMLTQNSGFILGNLGVGTTNPGTKFGVMGNGYISQHGLIGGRLFVGYSVEGIFSSKYESQFFTDAVRSNRKLVVNGAAAINGNLKIGQSYASTCDSSHAGEIRFNGGCFKGCNGATRVNLNTTGCNGGVCGSYHNQNYTTLSAGNCEAGVVSSFVNNNTSNGDENRTRDCTLGGQTASCFANKVINGQCSLTNYQCSVGEVSISYCQGFNAYRSCAGYNSGSTASCNGTLAGRCDVSW